MVVLLNRIKPVTIILSLLVFLTSLSMACPSICFLDSEDSLSDISLAALLRSDDDDATEDEEAYRGTALKKEKLFFMNHTRQAGRSDLAGSWYLVDANGSRIHNSSHYFTDRIDIVSRGDRTVFYNWGYSSVIYEGVRYGRLYIRTPPINIVRQLQIAEGKMYVYILDDGMWILDPIHEGGIYHFKKD